MITHRFPPRFNNPRSFDHKSPFHPFKTDGNVDNEQARALYLASKERSKDNLQDLSKSKSTSKIKKITKH
jgi:hypothetical protein